MLNSHSSNSYIASVLFVISFILFTEMHNFILSNTTKCHDLLLVRCEYIHIHKLAGRTAGSHVRQMLN